MPQGEGTQVIRRAASLDRETSGAIDFDAVLETYMETGDAAVITTHH